MCPDSDDYKLYFAQSLFKSGQYIQAQKVAGMIEQPQMAKKVFNLI